MYTVDDFLYTVVNDLPQETISEFFLSDPTLAYQSLHDHKLIDLHEKREYTKHEIAHFLGVYCGEELVFILNYTYFSDIAINIHVYLKTKYQHTPMYLSIQKALRKYFLENTQVIKIIAMSPKPCKHVQKTCELYGFKLEGEIKNALTWRQEVVDLLIYGLMLREN